MTKTAYADISTDVLKLHQLWRASRPLLVLLAAAALAACALHPGWRLRTAALAIGVALLLILVARRLMVGALPAHPRRMVWALEIELVGQLAWVVLGLGMVIFGAALATEHYPGKVAAYFTGLLAGTAVGYFSEEIFKPAEDDSWQAIHFRHAMASIYRNRFWRRDADGNWNDWGGKARWSPAGIEADALSFHQYTDELRRGVHGWDREARIRRTQTIAAGLRKAQKWTPPQ